MPPILSLSSEYILVFFVDCWRACVAEGYVLPDSMTTLIASHGLDLNCDMVRLRFIRKRDVGEEGQ